jgi:hypothetical protein
VRCRKSSGVSRIRVDNVRVPEQIIEVSIQSLEAYRAEKALDATTGICYRGRAGAKYDEGCGYPIDRSCLCSVRMTGVRTA